MRRIQRSATSILLGTGLALGIAGFSGRLLAPQLAQAADDKEKTDDKDKYKGVPYPNLHHAEDLLKEAKEYLEKGSHNMKGHRVAAIDHVDKAIAEIEAGLANPDNDDKDKDKKD